MTPGRRPTRRRLLAAVGTTATFGTAGCLDWFRNDTGQAEPSPGWYTDRSHTTAEPTKTFAYNTGERTPFRPVRPISTGTGTQLLVAFDYGHRESIRWWRTEYPEIVDLVEDGHVSPTLLMHPLPVNGWSTQLPAAVFEVSAQTTVAAAWEFHRLLVEAAPEYSYDLLADLAAEVGATPDAVVAAARTRRRGNQVAADRRFGEQCGVTDLPAIRWGCDPIGGTDAAAIREFLEERARS